MAIQEDELLKLVTTPSSRRATDRPTPMETFRGQYAEIQLADVLRRRAREVFETGDPAQSAICITEHLSNGQFTDLRQADHYACPTCGHLIKDRRRALGGGE